MLASDQKLDSAKLSPTSRKMLALREEVLAEWEKRVRARLKEANVLRQPVFINTIPVFYDNIVESVTPEYPRSNAVDDTTLAQQHGSERARLTNYDPAMVILEYQVFRWTLLELLERNGVALRAEELAVINTSIDNAIRGAVEAFTTAINALREQFIAALTHDLRNPLASATMAAELIMHSNASEEIRSIVAKILENHERMDSMIQGLLDTMMFQRGEKIRLDLTRFDILDVLREVCEHSVFAEQRGRLQLIGAPVQGWWDRQAMKRLVENLVGNALKYGAADTPIRIKVDQEHERMILSVHNEGEPIPPEEQEAIFLVFHRARSAKDSSKKGWGIGLPFVRAVAESHGGSVGIDSASGRGTTFMVSIPVDARPFRNVPVLAAM
jgi:signal transduction histidine kinase